MNAAATIAQAGSENAQLSPVVENDIAEAAAFIASQSGKPRESVQNHLRWLLLENPAREWNQPLGFALRASTGMVGCILCVPQFFCCREQKIPLMGSSSFYVNDRHRGYGGRLFLQYSRLSKRWPLFGTSANADAAALWKAAGAHPIPHSEGELFGIINWPPVAEELAHRRTSNPLAAFLARSVLSRGAALFHPLQINLENPGTLTPLTSAEQVCDFFPRERSSKLTALRDLSYFRWRYFSGHDKTTAAFAYRRCGRDLLVTVNLRTRGYRGQLKTLNLLDLYPEPWGDEIIHIAGSLIAQYANQIDALVLRNQNTGNRRHLVKAGFQLRAFDAPTGWLLDKTKSLSACELHFVPADGDGLI